jgi:hypothetical protein
MVQQSFLIPTMITYQETETTAYALRALPGVVDVLASAALHQVVVQFDESLISPKVIIHHLEDLGFMPHLDEQANPVTNWNVGIATG